MYIRKANAQKLNILLLIIAINAAYSFIPAYAQEQNDITLTVLQTGFNGYCKQGTWTALHISLENTGADFDARVTASYQDSIDANIAAYSTDVSLPASSRKKIFLYIHPRGTIRDLKITVFKDAVEVAKTNLRLNCVGANNQILGLITDSPAAFSALNSISIFNSRASSKTALDSAHIAQLILDDLPEHAISWEGLDALVISGVDTGSLTQDQKQSLRTWVSSGGKLFIVGGTKWKPTSAGLMGLLPMELDGLKTIDNFSEFNAYSRSDALLAGELSVAAGSLSSDAHVLIEQDGIPILIQKSLGFGKVYLFTPDPGLQPLNEWDGMNEIFQSTLLSPTPKPSWLSEPDSYSLNSAIGTISQLAMPSILILCCWLGIYIIVIGPINILVLRNIKRRELAWVTIPLLGLIFTGISYFGGGLYRGSTPVLNQLSVAQSWDGETQARVRVRSGLYSPNRTSYTIESDRQFMLSNIDGSLSTAPIKQNGDRMSIENVLIESSGLKSIAADGYIQALPIKHDLQISLGRLAPVLRGTITNASNYTLKDVVLITPGDMRKIGDLAPNETYTASVSITPAAEGSQFRVLGADDILGIQPFAPQSDAAEYRKNMFLRSLTSLQTTATTGEWGIYVAGWLDEIEVPIGLKDKKFETVNTMLYFSNVTPAIKTEAGQLKLTPGVFNWQSSEAYTSPYYVSQIPADGYILKFTPAFPVKYKSIASLTINVASSSPSQYIQVDAWNFNTHSWDTVDNGSSGINTISETAHLYAGPSGEVQIRIKGDQNQYVQINSANITLMVEQ